MLLTSILLSIALAMDCFAISIAIGIEQRRVYPSTAARTSIAFGLFQGLMPLIGFTLTSIIQDKIIHFGHYIAFALLALIGIKMIHEAIHDNDNNKHFDVARLPILLSLAIATSIDAFAVGISYGAINQPIITPSIIIAIGSAIFSILGLIIGAKLGNIFGNKAEIAGGIVLIILAINFLV